MHRIPWISLPLYLSMVLIVPAPADAVRSRPVTRDLELRLPSDLHGVAFETSALRNIARTEILPGSWRAQKNSRTGTLHFAYGSDVFVAETVPTEAVATALGRELLVSLSAELGTRPDNLELRNVFHYRKKYAVHFRQVLGGVPVHGGRAFVVLGETGQVTALGSDFFPDEQTGATLPTLSERDAIEAAARSLGATPREDRPVDAELRFVPAPSGEDLLLTIAWRVIFESIEPFGKWESFVHGTTGEILGRSNRYMSVDVIGNVRGDVEDPNQCDGNGLQGLTNLTVSVEGGESGQTDTDGNFVIPNAGADDVTVTAALEGPFANVIVYLGQDAGISTTATPGSPLEITFDGSNSRWDERDAFLHTNRAHDFMASLDPGFDRLDYPMDVIVAATFSSCPCNAWWSGSGMTFCGRSDQHGCANLGRQGSVIYHEYGHAVTQEWYFANGSDLPGGDLHEGNSDVFAFWFERAPELTAWMLNECDSFTRTAQNSFQWPDDNDGYHFGGQIISGFFWDAWQELLAVHPQAVADSVAWHTWHFGRGMGTPLIQPDQVLWTFLADDDDADLTNGTPNYTSFERAATNHGFSSPETQSGVTIEHVRLTHTTDDALGHEVIAMITSAAAAIDPTTLTLWYDVNGGGEVPLPLTATGNPDEYGATIPARHQHSEVEYWLSARDVAGNAGTDPALAPARKHAFDVAMLHDDLESGDAGWTTSATATGGLWVLGRPEPGFTQHGMDSTPNPGRDAWVTGRCSGHCTRCIPNCNDVDDGEVTLLSPVWNLSGAWEAKVKYDRWYMNEKGANPGEDFWVVDVSNDGGATWTNVENTNASNLAWRTHSIDIDEIFGSPGEVQVRFVASDEGGGSLVEAAVDEIRVLAAWAPTEVVALPATPALALSLSQNRPNPFGPATRIDFAIPRRTEVELTIYDVRGRELRRLVDGRREAGRYSAEWDGSDGRGGRASAGVYFCRLTADGRAVTRKMTLLP